jgi:cytochrome c oxidase accessory protein FixG
MIPVSEEPIIDFRSRPGVLDKTGHAKRMYPKKIHGPYFKARALVGYTLLAFLFIGPFLRVNGHPLFLFNVMERKFILFGLPFFPQDFFLFALVMLSGIVFIALFTAVFGRLFCGWVCPQTVFMEMVFRRIEYWIEGDANQQRQLNASGWTIEKYAKKGFKHLVFLLISFVIANTFLAYLIGTDELSKLITEGPVAHLGSFVALLAFTTAFYGVYAYFRELACIMACPYGRMQSVLLDKNSIVVAYDFVRGEPRGKRKKQPELQPIQFVPQGDCVDCKLCVQVCPTGIDIRNGTQLECINCTACMDACDEVMIKIGKPKGLIRHASLNNIRHLTKGIVTPRVIGYSLVLLALVSLSGFMLFSRTPLQMTVLRTPGQLFQRNNGQILNLYNADFVNKTFEPMELHLKLASQEGKIRIVGTDQVIHLPAQGVLNATFFVEIPENSIKANNTPLVLQAFAGEKLVSESKTSFLGPVQ